MSEVLQKNVIEHLSKFLSKKIPKRLEGVEFINLSVGSTDDHFYSVSLSLKESVINDECQQFKMYNEIQRLFNYYGIESGFQLRVVGQ